MHSICIILHTTPKQLLDVALLLERDFVKKLVEYIGVCREGLLPSSRQVASTSSSTHRERRQDRQNLRRPIADGLAQFW